ncbi:MAG: hypothetical protein K8W52_05810 [Deltaproteobacteria bacterium]|nr:hypothetical protein [Deltaproteobacteria bacterium]
MTVVVPFSVMPTVPGVATISWVSSSLTATEIVRVVRPVAVSVTEVVSLAVSASWGASTVTVCATFQLLVVKVSIVGVAAAAPGSTEATVTVVVAVGCWVSATPNVIEAPSVSVSAVVVGWMLT